VSGLHANSAATNWPTWARETRPWESFDSGLSSRQRSGISPEYEAAVAPQIARVERIDLPGDVAADLAEAEAAIERFDQRVGESLSGFLMIALRTEAASSSQIENLTASAKAVAMVEHLPSTAKSNPNARLIHANVTTLTGAINRDGDLDAEELIMIQRTLLEASNPRLTGSLRNEQAWIGGTNHSPHHAHYVAPHHDLVPAAIADWSKFAARRDLGRLAHIAVTHAHFESIHPFGDGNGRTGRVVVQRMMRSSGLTAGSILPISAGLLADTHGYFAAIDRYREGDVVPIVGSFISAAFTTIDNAGRLADDLAEIHADWRSRIHARSHSGVWPLLDVALRSPIVSAKTIAAASGMTENRTRAAIDVAVEAGVLTTDSPARRNRVWLVPDVIGAVEAFQDRSIRPVPNQRA